MLHSKYLTQEGMEITLKTLYKNGWRYIFRQGCLNEFYVSTERPLYSEDDTPLFYPERKACLGNTLNILMSDAMKGYNYITIADHIDEVDWSTVKVDTPVEIFCDGDSMKCNRHFADYRNGKVYVWKDGTTSWSADEEPIPVKNVKLAKG